MEKKAVHSKPKREVLIALFLLLLAGIAFGARYLYRKASFYPMGGPVLVQDRIKKAVEYRVIVCSFGPCSSTQDGGEIWNTQEFDLVCSKEQWEQMRPGTIVYCERNQSIVTGRGEVHTVKEVKLEKLKGYVPENYLDYYVYYS